jgi:hypothetical protein
MKKYRISTSDSRKTPKALSGNLKSPISNLKSKIGVCIALLTAVVCWADERMLDNARDFDVHGVRLGMSQRELFDTLPGAKRDPDAVAGITGAISGEIGQERWTLAKKSGAAREGHFEFLDSALYAMTWGYDGDREAFDRMRAAFVERLGTAHVIQTNAFTWLYPVVERRIEIVFEPIMGISVVVIDTEVVRRILERRVGDPLGVDPGGEQ